MNSKTPGLSKQDLRSEAERLVREAMEKKKLSVTKGETRIEAKCGKCGAPNRAHAVGGERRVEFTCKECGQKQMSL